MLNLIHQRTEKDCFLACLAMLTGRSLDAVRAELTDWYGREGGAGPLKPHQAYRYLRLRGYSVEPRFMSEAPPDRWPPRPFAPMHLAVVGDRARRRHAVVTDAAGSILDPGGHLSGRLEDYPGPVLSVAGVRDLYLRG